VERERSGQWEWVRREKSLSAGNAFRMIFTSSFTVQQWAHERDRWPSVIIWWANLAASNSNKKRLQKYPSMPKCIAYYFFPKC
jgi:hypothetical protein